MKKLIFVLALGLVLGMTVTASAAVVTALGTGDNWLWGYQSGWIKGPNYSNWTKADSLIFNVPFGTPVNLYFAVMNETRNDTAINPAGFLGQVTTDTGFFKETGTNQLLTNTINWQVALVPYATWITSQPTPVENTPMPLPTFNPTLIAEADWKTPNQYGDNSGDPNWWGDIGSVDGNALWLWTAKQYQDPPEPGQVGMDYLAVFRTTVTPVPEPASMALLGLGVLGLFGLKRKKIA